MKLISTLHLNRIGLSDNTTLCTHIDLSARVRTREGTCADCSFGEVVSENYFGASLHDELCFPCVHRRCWGMRIQLAAQALKQGNMFDLRNALSFVWLFAKNKRVTKFSNYITTHATTLSLLVRSLRQFVQRHVESEKYCSCC